MIEMIETENTKNKPRYEAPTIEFNVFESADIITTSGDAGGNDDGWTDIYVPPVN